MYLTLIILPLLGSIVSGFFGRKIGVTGAHIITIAGAESAIGLGILVAYYRLRGSISIQYK